MAISLRALTDKRCRIIALLLCAFSAPASPQTPHGRRLPASAREQAAFLLQVQLTDTSGIQRAVALNLLRLAQADVKREALPLIRKALADTSSVIRGRALGALERLGPEAAPALNTLFALASDSRERFREYAIELIAELGQRGPEERSVLERAANDPDEDIRLAAADAFRRVGEKAAARGAFRRSLESVNMETRLYAARTLAELNDSSAVDALRSFLADTSFRRRTQAAIALGFLGPKARGAVSELTGMLGDTALRRIPQGRAWVMESTAPYAAWALSMIIPFRTAFSNTVMDPLHVRVAGTENALQSDGLGVYAWGVDSVAVWRASGFFFMLSSLGEARGPIGPIDSTYRRSLNFDLSRPVLASGARPLGAVTDNEAYIWVWYKRDPVTDQVSTFRQLEVSDKIHAVERVEMHFRINGVLHELQMGPFVEGQGGASQWYTGVHGEGTTLAQFSHPENNLWIVRAPAGSFARLWSFENRARPVDRGLYEFPFELQFMGMPAGANGSCIPNPASCFPPRR